MRTKERFNLFRSKYSPWLPFRMLLTSFNHSLRSKNQQPPRHQTSYIFMVAKFWQPFKCTVVSMHNQKHVRLARFVGVVKIFISMTNGPAYLTSLPACRVQKASVLPETRTRWRDVGFMRLSLSSSSLYDWLRLSVTAASSPHPLHNISGLVKEPAAAEGAGLFNYNFVFFVFFCESWWWWWWCDADVYLHPCY